MKPMIWMGGIIAALLFSLPPASAPAAQAQMPADLIVVELKPGANINAVDAVTGATEEGADPQVRQYLVALPRRSRRCSVRVVIIRGGRRLGRMHRPCPTGLAADVAELQSTPGVAFAEPDEEVIVPEAQQRSRAFHESSMTSSDYVDQYALDLIGAAAAHSISAGQGVTVAVLDTGVDVSHPDLAGHLLPGYNVLDPGAAPSDSAADETPPPFNDTVACTGSAGQAPADATATDMPTAPDGTDADTPTADDGAASETPTPSDGAVTAAPTPGEASADATSTPDDSMTGGRPAPRDSASAAAGMPLDIVGDVLGPADSPPDDPDNAALGHGSAVAGIVAAVAPDACIMPIKVLDSAGQGTVFGVAAGIRYAVDNGAQVINLSLGTDRPSRTIAAALAYAAAHDVVVVTSAGNTAALDTTYPASDPNVLAVAATDASDEKADFSTYGPFVGVSAPGVDIYSTYYDGGYALWSGTSMAAPFVSGEAALILAAQPDERAGDVVARIEATAVNVDNVNPDYAGTLGAGRIDLAAALSH